MINWLYVFANSLWIVGLATLLTTFSLTHWQATQRAHSFRHSLSGPPFRLAVAAGFILFALGLTFLVDSWWYKIGWVAVLAISAWEGMVAWRERSA